ncbi:MAG: hypothetical protein GY756_00875 [bacterium]|nr:hypothetical protein [bacterium]
MEAHLLVRSADNQIWISASNSSRTIFLPLSVTIVRPDGTSNKVRRHTTDIVIEGYPPQS